MHSNISNGSLETAYENSTTDKIILSIYFITLAILSVSLNGLVIYLTKKHHQFHEASMYVRAGYSSFDIVFATSMMLHYLLNLHATQVPPIVTCLTGDLAIAMFFGTTQLTAFIALERYFYFCKPLKYHRYFNLKSIVTTVLVIFVTTQVYVYVKEVLYGRDLQPLIGMCVFTHPTFHNISNLLIFVLPAATVTCFSIYKIKKLLRKIAASAPHGLYPSEGITEPVLRRKAAKKSLR